MGTAISSLILIIAHHHHIKKKAKRGLKHVTITSLMAGAALLMLTLAFSRGPISIITVLMEIQLVLVFVFGIILSLFFPRFMKEKLNKEIILQKSISIFLIVVGTVLISI